MRYAHLLAAGCAAALAAGAASAATVTLSGGTPEALPAISGQHFKPELSAAGVDTLYRGPLTLTLTGASRLTFSLVAAESAFANTLKFGGAPIITETSTSTDGSYKVGDFLTGVLDGRTFVTGDLAGGTVLSDLLAFNGPLNGDMGADEDEFGVFSDASITGAGAATFFLSFDDDGANDDDNHDDIIVRVDVAPVPLPAAGLLLLGGLGGLMGLRRLRHAA